MGRHLMDMGYSPSNAFGKWLSAAFDAQLDGRFADLQGAIAYFKAHIAP